MSRLKGGFLLSKRYPMKIAQNWRALLKAYSTIALAGLSALVTAYAVTPELQAIIPPIVAVKIAGLISLLGLIGRFVEQPDVKAALSVILPAEVVQSIGDDIVDAATQAGQDAVQAAVDKVSGQ
jgi:hypothetical protein